MTTSSAVATPFSKVLIANRGEIALRIIRSARSLGYRTVAIYSTADADGRHVRAADEAVCVGAAAPAASYLNIPEILEAARLTGADAVHPGYGFLAENAEFAAACVGAGLVFIGPSADAIVSMGNKAGAKDIMSAAGVPCVPGYQGADQSEERMLSEAATIGYPVMIKATAGGGGRGMRLVPSAADFPELLRSARSEALNAFGDAHVILERAVVEPRHIEIQIIADRHGNAIHLGERDCSVQRRHQKVIEESPSPAIDARTREAMGRTAVTAVKAIGYEGAGTLEFLLDARGEFFFMEMNTRLQVEHPVTEFVTGLDLVELQLRIAAGEALPIAQADVVMTGHAIEIRLCAEDPDHGFVPQSGTMERWQMPSRLRVEDSLFPGAVVSPFYDSMIAKVISHGRTREEARRKLVSGLSDAVAIGVKTNQRFLLQCLSHRVFAGGGATTAFVGAHLEELLARDTILDKRMRALGAVLMSLSDGERAEPPDSVFESRRAARLLLEIDGVPMAADIEPVTGREFRVRIAGDATSVSLVEHDSTRVSFTCDGVTAHAALHRQRGALRLERDGTVFHLVDKTHTAANARADKAADDKLRASMNGRIVAVMAAVGDTVTAGQPLVTVEAMKMEHVHSAPATGTLRALHVNVGDQVKARTLLAEIDPINTSPAVDPARG